MRTLRFSVLALLMVCWTESASAGFMRDVCRYALEELASLRYLVHPPSDEALAATLGISTDELEDKIAEGVGTIAHKSVAPMFLVAFGGWGVTLVLRWEYGMHGVPILDHYSNSVQTPLGTWILSTMLLDKPKYAKWKMVTGIIAAAVGMNAYTEVLPALDPDNSFETGDFLGGVIGAPFGILYHELTPRWVRYRLTRGLRREIQ